jgi:hypothetical protein
MSSYMSREEVVLSQQQQQQKAAACGISGKEKEKEEEELKIYGEMYRKVFRRLCIGNHEIVAAARSMWIQKQHAMAHRYLANEATLYELSEMETYMYHLYYGSQEYVNHILQVQYHPHDQLILDQEQEKRDLADDVRYEDEWNTYMNEPYGDHSDDYNCDW